MPPTSRPKSWRFSASRCPPPLPARQTCPDRVAPSPDFRRGATPASGFREPAHPLAQLLTDGLDRVIEVLLQERIVVALAGLGLGDPLARELAGLNFLQDLLHAGADVIVDDARPARQIAVLRRLADELVHAGEAPLVNQIH